MKETTSLARINRLRRFRFGRSDRRLLAIVDEVRAAGLTYLEEAALLDLAETVRSATTRNVPGILIEAGCGLGGSTLVMAAAKPRQRPFNVYDVFGTIPPPQEKDGTDAQKRFEVIASGHSPGIGGNRYYGYEPDLQGRVRDLLAAHGYEPTEHNIRLIKGLFEQTLMVETGVAVAHIDCDWFDSVMICLERIEPYLVVGGRLIIDDYDHWRGCRMAVDEYFASRLSKFRFERWARLHIVRER